MSLPPPLPGDPIPRPPVPALPVYIGNDPRERPPLIAAIGILSIILASIGLLANAFFILQALMVHTAAVAFASPSFGVSAAGTAPAANEFVAPDGMSASERQLTIGVMSSMRPLSDTRMQMLDTLLGDAGQLMFAYTSGELQPQDVQNAISSAGQIPGASNRPGADYFVLGRGRLELFDDHAVFFRGGGQPALRVQNGTFQDAGAPQLATTHVDAVLRRIQSLCRRNISDGQQRMLVVLMYSGDSITPSASPEQTAAQVTSASLDADGTLVVHFSGSPPLTVSAAGSIGAGAGAAGPALKVNHRSLVLSAADGALGVLLSGYLMICGIIVLRGSLLGRRLHLIYALIKVPLAILGGFAAAWVWGSISFGAGASSAAPAPGGGAIVLGVLVAAAGLAYPIGLLIALNGAVARDYYSDAAV